MSYLAGGIFDGYVDYDYDPFGLDIDRMDGRYFGEGDFRWEDFDPYDDDYFVNAPAMEEKAEAQACEEWKSIDGMYSRLEVPRPHRRKWFLGKNLAA